MSKVRPYFSKPGTKRNYPSTSEKSDNSICSKIHYLYSVLVYDLVPKGAQMVGGGGGGGSSFWLSVCFKHFVLLLLCVCIHNWSVSQWKQYELQLEKYLFLKVKSTTELDPWKRTCSQWVLSMLLFTYMTNQNTASVTNLYRGDITLDSAYNIDYH